LIFAGPLVIIAQQINIGSGAKMVIGVGATVSAGSAEASGTVTNTDTTRLVIQSSASGSGSLICGGTPAATVQRYVTANRWNMVSPTTNAVDGGTFFLASGSDSWLTKFHEPSGTSGAGAGTGWIYITKLDSTLPPGNGFSYYPSVNETVPFAGDLTSSNLTPSLSWSGESYGYNLLGNPFPCTLYWDNTWTMPNVEKTIWIWDGSQYQSYPGASAPHYVPVGQGFFVRATAESPSITIPASKRAHNSQAFLKNGDLLADLSFIVIHAYNNDYEDKVQVSFAVNGTDQFDNGYDATKMFGLAEAPQLYIADHEDNLSYNHLPLISTSETKTVALSYIPGIDGEQVITAEMVNFSEMNVTLEDLKTGEKQQLKQNPDYTFMGSKADDPERFLLHFNSSAYGIDDPGSLSESNMKIYASGKTIFIKSTGDAISQGGVLCLYDLTGRQLAEYPFEKGGLVNVKVDFSNAYLIARVIKPSEVRTAKVYIN